MSPLNSQNILYNARMLASGSGSQTSPMSQSYLPGPSIPARNQQLDQPLLQQQLQQLQN
ncbi:hypothetical protein AXF42_Ash004984 [Apostasia shenzhenica]|uniref:Uncharacterized protein n=1 Tax=Apostasia shenzhenica TaxID=1088818 RepID=A0A2I0B847_9ASPA|nr:hypothetical protein AXF42_Ash004984 [Apostasia shenzhenica]